MTFTTAAGDYGAYAHNVDHDGNASTPAVSVNETVGWAPTSSNCCPPGGGCPIAQREPGARRRGQC